MALTDKKFSPIHGLTGNNKNSMKAKFDDGYHEIAITEVEENPVLAALVYQIGQLEEEIDYLRTEISTNKDKSGITTSQANAITANTAKTGITPSEQRDIAGNKTSIANNVTEITKLTRGKLDMVTLPLVQPGVEQGVECGVVYDSKAKTYSMMFAYSETVTIKGKKQVVTKTGSIQLK